MDNDKTTINQRLMAAVQKRDCSAVKKALDDGADANFKRGHDIPLQLAKAQNASDVVSLLLSKGAKTDSIPDKRKNHQNVPRPPSLQQQPGYKKRDGTACLGQFYETKLLTLVLLRALQDEEIQNFYLGTNMADAGAFDDIVLRYTKKGKVMVYLLQAKHVKPGHVNLSDMINVPKGNFSLQKYFESYVQIKKQFHRDHQNVIFRGDFEKVTVEFLIYTTANVNLKSYEKTILTQEAMIFRTNPDKQFFRIIDQKLRTQFKEELEKEISKPKPSLKICSDDVEDTIIKNFFENLIFCVEQPNEGEFDQIIADEVLKTGRIAEEAKAKIAKTFIHDAVQEWWKQNENVVFYTERCDLLEKIIYEVEHKPLLDILHSLSIKKLKYNNIVFTFKPSELIDKVGKIVQAAKKEKIFISSTHPELSALKVIQYLEHQNIDEGNYKFINANHVDIDCILKPISHQPCLIVSLEKTNIRQIADQICKYFERLIVITSCEYGENCVKDENIRLGDLDGDSQNKILQHRISFQGKPVTLGSFVCDDPILIDADIVSRVIAGEAIEIAKPCEKELVQYYVHRTFRRCTFKAEILNNESFLIISENLTEEINIGDRDVIILFKQAEGEYFTKNNHDVKTDSFYNLEEAKTYYNKLRSTYRSRNIHLLSAGESKQVNMSSEKELIWHQTHNDVAQLRKFMSHDSKNVFKPRTFDDFEDDVVILAAEPGMGKSLALTSLAAESSAKRIPGWIVRIDLLIYSEQFNKWQKSSKILTKSDVFEFLLKITKHEGETALFSKIVFQKYCNEKKLILLVDGFDEISPNYMEIVQQLLKMLKDTFASKLLVTTRCGDAQIELEKCLSTFACSLEPFNREDQETFLRKFWQTSFEISIDEARCLKFIKYLFSELLVEAKRIDFSSVPLQIKMIASTFAKQFATFYNSSNAEPTLKDIQFKNLKQLYDEFMTIQIDDVFAGKMDGANVTNLHSKELLDDFKSKTRRSHMLAAVHVLFSNEEMCFLFDEKDNQNLQMFLKRVSTGEEKTGVVYQNSSGNAMFIHQTYAEYFAALLLSQKYSKLSENTFRDFLKIVVVGGLLRGNKTQTCSFLHMILMENMSVVKHKTFKSHYLLKVLLDSFAQLQEFVEGHASKELLKIVEYSIDNNEPKIFKLLRTKEQKKSLLAAACNMGCDRLLSLISQQMDVNEPYKGYYPLHLAVYGNDFTTVEFLIKQNANLDARETSEGATPLYIAAKEGFEEIVKLLLENDANVNVASTDDGFTPLHWAAQKNFPDLAELLITNGANVNATRTDNGATPLHSAALKNSKDVAQLLLANGANVHACTSNYGSTPLHWAAEKNFPELAELLIAKGANVNAPKTDNGATPLHSAALKNSKDVAQLLLANGADVHACTSNYGSTPLHWAAQKNFPELAELLIANGANVNAPKTDNGATPLHSAALSDSKDVAQLVLANGADVHACTSDYGRTPLHCAAQVNSRNTAELLIANGANVNAGDANDGFTPLHWAAQENFPELAELLIANGANVNAPRTDNGATPLHSAALKNSKDVAQLLLAYGADVHACTTDDYRQTPLRLAAEKNSQNTAKLLIANGANVNARDADDGITPLHIAAVKNYPGFAELLIANGANMNIKTTDKGETPLHMATEKDSIEVAKLLLEKGADLHAYTTNSGETALHLAVKINSPAIVELLIEYGAMMDACTLNNETPLSVASKHGHSEIEQLLRKSVK